MLAIFVPLIAFWLIFLLALRTDGFVEQLKGRGLTAWAVDGLGLLMQGWVFPLMQAFLLLPLLRHLWPAAEGSLGLSAVWTFLLSFVAVDYLYYWNHRLLHSPVLWPWHRTHHSAPAMDIFVSSRNGLLTHFLICYVWIHALALFLLKDDGAYILGSALTSALDLWRHSPLKASPAWQKVLGCFLILPRDHAWHHARNSQGENFSANFNFWDKLHGTWRPAPSEHFLVGTEDSLNWPHLIRPFAEPLPSDPARAGAV